MAEQTKWAENLDRLRRLIPDAEAAVVIGLDGELVASSVAEDLEEVIAPMLVTLVTVADQTSQELGRGGLDLLVLEGPEGWLVVQAIDAHRVLGVLCGQDVSLGLLLDDLRATRDQMLCIAA